MRPLSAFPRDTAGRILAVLTDIDDTLTVDGRLPSVAYEALERLHEAGLIVVPVTGRPAGWCDLIARQWPVDAVVGENGAFWFRYEDATRRMVRHFARSQKERVADRVRLDAVRRDVLASVPGTALSADQSYREADLAIDFREDVPPLAPEAVDRIASIFHAHGATAKVSSIHVNGWYGSYDKLSTSLGLLRDVFGIDATANADRVVFVGDSPNDAPMFGHFPNAVGVANVGDFVDRMPALPAYVASYRSAQGFRELADLLLAARMAPGAVAAR